MDTSPDRTLYLAARCVQLQSRMHIIVYNLERDKLLQENVCREFRLLPKMSSAFSNAVVET
jgi:hypothetical protein